MGTNSTGSTMNILHVERNIYEQDEEGHRSCQILLKQLNLYPQIKLQKNNAVYNQTTDQYSMTCKVKTLSYTKRLKLSNTFSIR